MCLGQRAVVLEYILLNHLHCKCRYYEFFCRFYFKIKMLISGYLVGSVSGESGSQSWGGVFKPCTGPRVYFKNKKKRKTECLAGSEGRALCPLISGDLRGSNN